MYYEEKLIDGIMHWRSRPGAEFQPYTLEGLSRRYQSVKDELHRVSTSMDSLKDS